MIKQLAYPLAVVCCALLSASPGHRNPVRHSEKAVTEERGGWAGDKSRLSTVFDAERKRLENRFESELLKWLGNDPERHYWISFFLESESYLHSNKPLPHLSLLVKQQGLALVQGKDDEESRGYVVRFSITAAIVSDQLGFSTLARFYKNEAEGLLLRQPELSVFVPGLTETDRRSYDGIKSAVSRKMPSVVGDTNPQPAAYLRWSTQWSGPQQDQARVSRLRTRGRRFRNGRSPNRI